MFLFIVFLTFSITFCKTVSTNMKPGIFKHFNCRNGFYPKSNIKRFQVPDDLTFWTTTFPDYKPPIYTAPHINGQIWADPDIQEKSFKPLWNCLDRNVNRISYVEKYKIKNDYPINPYGRTGLQGRGLLGRWGPNHAADPIVTRWKRNKINGDFIKNSNTDKPILQMIAIQREDNKKWAIPGGMVDPGEKVSTTLKREFIEEALSTSDKEVIEDFFSSGIEIFKGYVDDFRNTDNAWMETVAYNFHDESDEHVGKFKLMAGDDAVNVKWIDIDSSIDLHASHSLIIEKVVKRLNAHW